MISAQEERILSRIGAKSEELASMMQDLIRFASVNPPGNERPIANYVGERLKGLGFDVRLVEVEKGRPNVLARLKGKVGKPRLVCYSHLDVVPPGDLANWSVDPFEGKRVGDKIFGRGAQDHKFPIPPFIVAIDTILESTSGIGGDVVFTFVAGEETGGTVGFRHLVENGYLNDSDAMLYGGIGIEKNDIIIGANGQLEVTVEIRGKTTHTATLENGVNAITKSIRVLSEFQRQADQVNTQADPLTGNSRMSINKIWAGDKTNILPDKCLITIDRRVTPHETFDQAESELRRTVDKLRAEDRTLEIELKTARGMPPVRCPPDSQIVEVAKEVGEDILGTTIKLRGLPASSDYSWYVNILNKPCCMFAITSPELGIRAHAPDEYCLVPDLVQTAKAYALVMMRYLSTV